LTILPPLSVHALVSVSIRVICHFRSSGSIFEPVSSTIFFRSGGSRSNQALLTSATDRMGQSAVSTMFGAAS
jgi:hypothetical protein